MARAVIVGAACAAALGLVMGGCSDSSGEADSTASPTFSVPVSTGPEATATPNQTEYIATMRQQGFDQAESVLLAWGSATCGLLAEFTVKEAQERIEGGAIPGLTGERNIQIVMVASSTYLCPEYSSAVRLVVGEEVGSSITPTP